MIIKVIIRGYFENEEHVIDLKDSKTVYEDNLSRRLYLLKFRNATMTVATLIFSVVSTYFYLKEKTFPVALPVLPLSLSHIGVSVSILNAYNIGWF